jgi:hypothetical protein
MTGLELLEAAAPHAVDAGSARSFGEHAAQHLAQPWIAEMAVVLEDNLREMSRTALDALASTHDFFALHLVTGSHAFRVLESHAGPDAAAVMNLGLLAGYLVIGAPTVRHFPTPKEATAAPDLLALCRDDEHDAKLAHTTDAQARHWNDPAYVAVAARYLTRNARGTG